MDVLSVCPLRTASLLWQPRPATWVLTVVVKATYALRPGDAVLAPEQEPPNEEDDHWNDDASRSVYAPNDLIPAKPRPEVLLVGHAFAPGGTPVRSLVARITLGDLDKAIEVFCDRSVATGGVIQEGAPLARFPLLYECAAGGPGTGNPVGVRASARDRYGRRILPNLQPVGTELASPDAAIEPIGFGPLAPRWPTRVELLGVHAAQFPFGRPPGDWVLPEGVDITHYNQAPRDQQLAVLRENERIVLENLHPEHSLLLTALPGLRPAAFIDRGRGPAPRLGLRADTLWIDTDRAIATLTWRGQLQLERADEAGHVLVGMEMPGGELTWADVERTARQQGLLGGNKTVSDTAPPAAAEDDAHTLEPFGSLRPSAPPPLPFQGGPPRDEKTERKNFLAQPPRPGAGLPFQPASSSSPSPPAWPTAAPPKSPSFRAPQLTLPDISSAPAEGAAWPPPASAQLVPPPATPMIAAPPPLLPVPVAPQTPPPPAPAAPSAIPSAAAASTAAAIASAAMFAPAPSAAAPAPTPAPAPAVRAILPRARPDARDAVRLIWYEPESVPRLRRTRAFRPILDELEKLPLDAELDDPAAAKDPAEMEERREVFQILTRGEPTDAEGVNEAISDAVRDDGKFVPPILLASGDLSFPFDELETLKATLTAVTPLVTPTDESLKSTIELAREFLKTPGLLSGPAVAEGLTTRLKDAFGAGKRMVPAAYLETQTERALLEHRHYQKRLVFGAPHLRALFHAPGGSASNPIPTYLPADIAAKLPLYQRFRVRMLVEVHFQEDQSESHIAALRVLSIGRAFLSPRR